MLLLYIILVWNTNIATIRRIRNWGRKRKRHGLISVSVTRSEKPPMDTGACLNKRETGGEGKLHTIIKKIMRIPIKDFALATLILLAVSCADTVPGFDLVKSRSAVDIYVDSVDWPGITHAAENLADDIESVSGRRPRVKDSAEGLSANAVIVGSIGRSPVIDSLAAAGKLDVSPIAGKWEAYTIAVVQNPVEGVEKALVIIGSDKRGTIYGIYSISDMIGVSPWAFFADSVPPRKGTVTIPAATVIRGEPSVKYRGIFINDERQTQVWLSYLLRGEAGKLENPKASPGFNHLYYTKLFDLILRLKGNLLWPAMWNNAFFSDDPLNPVLADEWGIVIGTSHHEFMSRPDKEWNWLTEQKYGDTIPNEGKKQNGLAWRFYDTVADPDPAIDPINTGINTQREIIDYWKTGLGERKGFEQIVTLGLRGQEDTAALPDGDMKAQIDLLTNVVRSQRQIIAGEYGGDAAAVPQALVLYNEVDRFYYGGFEKMAPDDVIVILADDFHGNTRTLPGKDERDRAGGFGMYYHFEMNGPPRSDRFVDTMPLEKMREQMVQAYDYGVRSLWITNVGNLKFNEVPTEYWMNLAWDIDAWRDVNAPEQFYRQFAAREFGAAATDEAAEIIFDYVQMNKIRAPEWIYPTTFSVSYFDEARAMLQRSEGIRSRAEALAKKIRPEQQDAYYEMVLYPARASANILKLMVNIALNRKYADLGMPVANTYAQIARDALEFDNGEMRYWKTIRDGKWTGYFPVNPPGETSVVDGKVSAAPNNAEKDQNIYHIGMTRWNHPVVQFSFSDDEHDPTCLKAVDAADGSSLIVVPQSVMGAGASATEGAVDLHRFTSYRNETRYIEIGNKKQTPFRFTAQASDPWIKLSRTSGSVEQVAPVEVSIDWQNIPAGTAQATGTITVRGADSEVRVNVTAEVFDRALPASLPERTFIETDGYVSMLSRHYAVSMPSPGGAKWDILPRYGRELSSVKVTPNIPDIPCVPGVDSPYLEYRVYIKTPGSIDIVTQWAPSTGTNAMRYTKMQYGVSFGGDGIQTVNTLSPVFAAQSRQGATWPFAVETATRSLTGRDGSVCWSRHQAAAPGLYTVRIYMIDDGMVLQKIFVGTAKLTDRVSTEPHAGTLRCNPETREVFDPVNGTMYQGQLVKEISNYTVPAVGDIPRLFVSPVNGNRPSPLSPSFFGPPETYYTGWPGTEKVHGKK
jgi:hypothetical protein